MTPALVVPVLGRKLYPGASVALDFTRNLYRSGTPVVKGSPSLLSGWTFTRASTGYAETAAGALVAFASGAPRTTDKGLLVEEARTNLLLRSQEFDNASWTKTNLTVSANAATAPDGTLTADKLVSASGTSQQRVHQAITAVAATAYTVSAYFKVIPGEATWVALRLTEDGAPSCWFDIANVALGTRDAGWSASTITALGNGWVRVTATHTTIGTSYTYRFYLANSNGDITYTGDAVKGIYIWGAQLEAGAFATSYIPTTTASATRAADVATIATTSLAYPLTLLAAWLVVDNSAASRCVFGVNIDGSDANRAYLRIASNLTTRAVMTSGGVEQAAVTPPGTAVVGTIYKHAGRFATNDVNAALAGSTGTADTTATLPTTPNEISIGRTDSGGEFLNAYIRLAVIYPTAFTDAQLQAATA